MEQFYKLLRFEIEARNSSETAGNTSRKSKLEKPLTLQTLMSALEEKFEQKNKGQFSKQKGNFCLFFKDEHYSDKCSKVRNLDDRIKFLKRNRCCFKCIMPGYSKANCKRRTMCFKCRSFGYHTALCRNVDKITEKDKNKPGNTYEKQKENYAVCHDKSFLLQTAKGVITNIDESKIKRFHMLFDLYSQSSYITRKAVKTLSLELVDGGNVTIRTLGKKNSA